MNISSGKVATIDYTLTDETGEVLDQSKEEGPLSYLHGFGNIIPGLEAALEGRTTGDALKVEVAPSDAYGERDEELVNAIERERFPQQDIKTGMRFHAHTEHGSRMLTVIAVDEDEVTIDANHPLAGKKLSFDVKVIEVRDATKEELEHGHVHGAHGHEH
jgi:FKBP-type peptidyl-prolyl cis-trans isomerase SlyD